MRRLPCRQRNRIERGSDRIDAFLHCRTPQDFAALQGELLRDNMETVVGYARKAREHSARLADEAERRFGNLAEVMTSGEVGGRGQTTQRRPCASGAAQVGSRGDYRQASSAKPLARKAIVPHRRCIAYSRHI